MPHAMERIRKIARERNPKRIKVPAAQEENDRPGPLRSRLPSREAVKAAADRAEARARSSKPSWCVATAGAAAECGTAVNALRSSAVEAGILLPQLLVAV
jgi:hypothetical protein